MRTVITSKSFRGLNVRKKDKRKIKHHLFKQSKIHSVSSCTRGTRLCMKMVAFMEVLKLKVIDVAERQKICVVN